MDGDEVSEMVRAVNGWKQAVGIVQAQAIALDWCVAQFAALKRDGRLPRSEAMAREYLDVVMSARNAGIEYLDAMRRSGANT